MRIVLVTCVFPPEPVVSAQTSAQIAKELRRRGHCVEVVTSFPNRPAGKLHSGYRRRLFQREHAAEGYHVLRCFSFFSSRDSMMSRFLENLSFGISSSWAVLSIPKPDAVYANTWPIFAHGLLWLICYVRNIPFVLSVQDIYPESLLAQNRLAGRESWIFRLLLQVDTFIARHCQAIIVVSEAFKRFYTQRRGIPSEVILTIPNWNEEAPAMTLQKEIDIRARNNIPENAFLVAYGGNIGPAAGVDQIIRAFDQLADRENIYLLIAGDGTMRKSCQALARTNSNRRIRFYYPWPSCETYALLEAADLLVLPTQTTQSLVSMPSKLISYLQAGRPVLALAEDGTELGETLRRSGGGWVIAPGNPTELAQRIAEISAVSREELDRCGDAGREFAHHYYSKAATLYRVIDVLENISNKAESALRLAAS